MLKKILKYDLLYIYKVLIVFYTLSLFFAVMTRITTIDNPPLIMLIINKILSGTTIALIINIIINSIMRIWVRFKNNIYGDESYLTHTLPVKKRKHIFIKNISDPNNNVNKYVNNWFNTIYSMLFKNYNRSNKRLIKFNLPNI